MALLSGTRIGAYEITGPIGAGGMGEVYRARDHRLQRDVAVKVLPDRVERDPDRLVRFEREARTLASLNHPNIAIVHGFEESAGAHALVMELVEGPTLADRISQGPLPPDEAIAIASQIAEALEAAHEQGIIHRDLKPANVKVRPDGTVKVLDFGLAKVFAPSSDLPQVDPTLSPTITSPPMTSVGIILGTAAYMSPEQARGRPVDKRADIWAFGCVLFEMLTARPAFAGETTTDILAAVVQREPEWSRLPAALPPSVGSLLRRCLQKNPRERLRDIGDARADLRSTSPAHIDSAAFTPTVPPIPAARGWRSVPGAVAWFAAGAVVAAAISYVASIARSGVLLPDDPVRVVVTLPPDTTLALGRGSSLALSPDGRRLVYAGRSREGTVRLYVRALDRFESEPIAGTENAANPFFSPDGRWVGFFAEGRLKKVSLDGGAPVGVAEVLTPRGEAWTPDDAILVTPSNNTGISRISAGGGRMEPLTSLAAGEMSHRWPRVLSDGSAVLFTIWNDTGWEPSRIAAQRAGATDHTIVIENGGGYPRYVRDSKAGRGYLVYARSEGLLAAPFNESQLKVTGPPVPVVDGVITNLSGGAHFDLARNGTLAYVPGTLGEADRDLVWVTLDGKETFARRIARMGRFFALSPDGTRVLRNNTVGQRDVWVEDLARGTSTRLTNAPDNFSGVWSSDGAWVAFARGAPVVSIYRRRVDQSATEERLTSSPRSTVPSSFSPDGTTLAYSEADPVSGSDVWVLPLPATSSAGAGAGAPAERARPFVKTNFSEGNAKFSPDGHWIAYQCNESGRFEVYVRSFPDGERTLQVSADGGLGPMWSGTGREIFYRATNGRMMAAAVKPSPDFQLGKPRELFDARSYENVFGVAPDGQRLLMMRLVQTEQSATQVHVVLNFLSDLRQRVR